MLLAEITSSGMDMSVILNAALTTGVICTVGWVAYVFRQSLYNIVAGFGVLVALLIGGPVVALLAAVLLCPDFERNVRRPAAPRPPRQPRDAAPSRVAAQPVEPVQQAVEQPVGRQGVRPVVRPVEHPVERQVVRPVVRPVERRRRLQVDRFGEIAEED